MTDDKSTFLHNKVVTFLFHGAQSSQSKNRCNVIYSFRSVSQSGLWASVSRHPTFLNMQVKTFLSLNCKLFGFVFQRFRTDSSDSLDRCDRSTVAASEATYTHVVLYSLACQNQLCRLVKSVSAGRIRYFIVIHAYVFIFFLFQC